MIDHESFSTSPPLVVPMYPETVAALRAAGDPHIGADGRVPHGSSDDPDVLDFSANTNPRVPPGARDVFEGSFDATRSYPDDGYPDFRAAAAGFVGCNPEQVVPTAGGLEAIRLAIGTSVRAGGVGVQYRVVINEGRLAALQPHLASVFAETRRREQY